MATYTNISATEMEEFLADQGFKQITLPNTVELVYGKRVDNAEFQLTLRVFTGINPSGESREVGADAIRVNLFLRTKTGSILKLGGSKRVHRVAGWKKNLQSRIDHWMEYLPKQKCKLCGLPMVFRKSGKSTFLGCCSFPSCKFTQQIKD